MVAPSTSNNATATSQVDADGAAPRLSFAKIHEPLDVPNLLALQTDSFDWLIIADDDIALEPGFLDDFIAASEAAGLSIAQPAHRFDSYANFGLTHRRWGALVRETRFVEIGPGGVLSKMLKRRVSREIQLFSVQDEASLVAFLEAFLRAEKEGGA